MASTNQDILNKESQSAPNRTSSQQAGPITLEIELADGFIHHLTQKAWPEENEKAWFLLHYLYFSSANPLPDTDGSI